MRLSGDSQSTYRPSRGEAFWGVVYPLALGAFGLASLIIALCS
jgi:hypothetical protein